MSLIDAEENDDCYVIGIDFGTTYVLSDIPLCFHH